MVNKSLVSLIIVNFNGISYTRACLKSLKKTTYPNYEIVLVDNDSDNDEIGQLKKEFGKYINQAVKNDQNVGFPRAVNLAAKVAKGELICLLNNDLEFEPEWLTEFVRAYETDPKIIAVGPKLMNINQKGKFEYAYASGGWLDILGYPFCRGRIFDTIEPDRGQFEDPIEVFWFPGGAGLINRKFFLKYGGYDASFFMYAEESDFCWKIAQSGHRVVCNPKAVIYHHGSATNQSQSGKKLFYIHRNNFMVLFRNLPFWDLMWVVPARQFLEWITVLKYLFGAPGSAWAVWRGNLSAWWNLPAALRNRRQFEGLVDHNIMPPTIYPRSIVIDYYYLGLKKFSDLKFELPKFSLDKSESKAKSKR